MNDGLPEDLQAIEARLRALARPLAPPGLRARVLAEVRERRSVGSELMLAAAGLLLALHAVIAVTGRLAVPRRTLLDPQDLAVAHQRLQVLLPELDPALLRRCVLFTTPSPTEVLP